MIKAALLDAGVEFQKYRKYCLCQLTQELINTEVDVFQRKLEQAVSSTAFVLNEFML